MSGKGKTNRKWQTAGVIVIGIAVLLGILLAYVLPDRQKSASPSADFPQKPITLIVPYAAGGGTDFTARALAQAAEKHLDQPIVVVNRTGGGGSVGLTEGAHAKSDGYTVTFLVAELTTLPHLGLLPVTYEDFTPIAQTNRDPAAITVRADAPWQNAREFLEYAHAHPGEIKMGNAGTGSIWHLAAAMLEKEANAKFTHIPYEGAGPAVSALLSGFVDAVPVSPAEVKSYVEQGRLRTLTIIGDEEAAALPGVPTLAGETGLHVDFVGTWRGLAVPKGTPDSVRDVLAEAFIQGTKEPEFISAMDSMGLGLLVRDDKGFSQQLKQSHDLYAELIPELGLSRK